MAYTDVAMQGVSLNVPGANVEVPIALTPKSSTGTTVDVTGWNAWEMQIVPAQSSFFQNTFTNSATVALINSSAGKALFNASLNNLEAGSYKYQLSGKPAVGDTFQCIASGNLTIT